MTTLCKPCIWYGSKWGIQQKLPERQFLCAVENASSTVEVGPRKFEMWTEKWAPRVEEFYNLSKICNLELKNGRNKNKNLKLDISTR